MGLALWMPWQHFLDPLVEDQSLLSEPGGARVGDLPLAPAAVVLLPCVEVRVVLAWVVHTPVDW